MAGLLLEALLVALGGAAGGVGRFWLSGVVARRFGEAFPWGTLAVNVSGAACIGALAGLALAGDPVETAAGRPLLWPALALGVLGSYTTVSSFSLQTLALLRSGETARAIANVIASLALCLGAAAAGFAAGALPVGTG